MRSCPNCGNALTETLVGEIRVDGCENCGGVWFDRGELNAVAKTQMAQMTALDAHFAAHTPPTDRQAEKKCPVCHVALFAFEFPRSPGIQFDGCPQCGGLWADDGKLTAIHHRLLSAMAPEQTKAPTDIRQKARSAFGFLTSKPCPSCGQPNPVASPTCWACGTAFTAKQNRFCPCCDKPLQARELPDVRIDTCDDCGGIWLDVGEMPALVARGPEGLQKLEKEMGLPAGNISVALETRPQLMCPDCYVPMEGGPFAYDADIRVDNCEQCYGVWVGAGELEQITQYYVERHGPYRRLARP